MAEDAARDAALIEFIGTFETVSEPIEAITDLSDGVALFEALSEIAPEYFDPTTIARHLGDNWALKSSNLRKLVRNLENYYHHELQKTANCFTDDNGIEISKVARQSDVTQIVVLLELVAAAAVTCPEKGVYVQRIMNMSGKSQLSMKSIIETSMTRLTDHMVEGSNSYDDDDGGGGNDTDENELVFGGAGTDDEDSKKQQPNSQQLFGGGSAQVLEQQLDDARRELATSKANIVEQQEEHEKAQSKLQNIIQDLQDRLMKRQDELIQAEEDLQQTTSELEETKSKLADLQEQKATLEDDLDLAKSKAEQLYRAEATVMAYKKKLEGVGARNQQMEDLEGQAEKYVRQIMELEAEAKKVHKLQKNVKNLEETITKLEKEKSDRENVTKTSATEIADLKTKLQNAESAKKLFEEELMELRAKTQAAADIGNVDVKSSSNNLSPDEKVKRLEAENQQLKAQLLSSKSSSVPPVAASVVNDGGSGNDDAAILAIAVEAPDDTPETKILKSELKRLHGALSVKEKENAKIASDKDKLEAYTKRTLAKFQDKYLVALQECKAKLKEKQDKIELLEKRSASERSAQKREERLLSSAIYELGLGIMQSKLKGGN